MRIYRRAMNKLAIAYKTMKLGDIIMKKMQIFEPAMCCSTGLCGVSVDPELLRISTVLNTLKKNGVAVDRFNLSSAPMAFVHNKVINTFINEKGAEDPAQDHSGFPTQGEHGPS